MKCTRWKSTFSSFPLNLQRNLEGLLFILLGLLALLIFIAPNVVWFSKVTLQVNVRNEGTNFNWYTDTYSSNSAILSSSVERQFIEESLDFLVFLDSSIVFIISGKKLAMLLWNYYWSCSNFLKLMNPWQKLYSKFCILSCHRIEEPEQPFIS